MGARIVMGERYDGRELPLRPESVRVPLAVVLLSLVGRYLARLFAAIARQPWLWVPTVIVLALWILIGLVGLLALILGVVGIALAWARLHRHSFDRLVGLPIRAVWRRLWVYRRFWQPAMVTAGLDVQVVDRQYLPQLRKVRSTKTVDRVLVKMLPGQILDDYAEQAERLAMSLGAVECRVRPGPKHGEVELWFLVDDPLHEIVPVLDAPSTPDFARLPVARSEDGEVFELRLLGNHLLVVGATGAGKGSVLWSLVHVLHRGISEGVAELWVCDPKGGMEFASGAPLFRRYAYGDSTVDAVSYEVGFAEFLEEAVSIMRKRQAQLRGNTRLHQPTPGDPLVVLVVDELASLTAYVTDRDAKKRISAALSLLLSQGRAVGVVVVAALQDPRKDVLPFRDLFPTRIALRLTEPEQVDMTLGDGARRRGARCDRIPENLPGVGYVVVDGVAEPLRVRFPFITDEHINSIAIPDDLSGLQVAETSQRGSA